MLCIVENTMLMSEGYGLVLEVKSLFESFSFQQLLTKILFLLPVIILTISIPRLNIGLSNSKAFCLLLLIYTVHMKTQNAASAI